MRPHGKFWASEGTSSDDTSWMSQDWASSHDWDQVVPNETTSAEQNRDPVQDDLAEPSQDPTPPHDKFWACEGPSLGDTSWMSQDWTSSPDWDQVAPDETTPAEQNPTPAMDKGSSPEDTSLMSQDWMSSQVWMSSQDWDEAAPDETTPAEQSPTPAMDEGSSPEDTSLMSQDWMSS